MCSDVLGCLEWEEKVVCVDRGKEEWWRDEENALSRTDSLGLVCRSWYVAYTESTSHMCETHKEILHVVLCLRTAHVRTSAYERC